jgi:hypothetical protein
VALILVAGCWLQVVGCSVTGLLVAADSWIPVISVFRETGTKSTKNKGIENRKQHWMNRLSVNPAIQQPVPCNQQPISILLSLF